MKQDYSSHTLVAGCRVKCVAGREHDQMIDSADLIGQCMVGGVSKESFCHTPVKWGSGVIAPSVWMPTFTNVSLFSAGRVVAPLKTLGNSFVRYVTHSANVLRR